jgi:hypothetical protein
MRTTIYIERNDTEIAVAIEGDLTPETPATRDEPGESAFAEITSAKGSDGAEIELTATEIKEAQEALFEAAEDRYNNDAQERAEARAEARASRWMD